MINIVLIFILSSLSWSSIDLNLTVPSPHVKQGAIVDATVRMDKTQNQSVGLQSLIGKIFGKTVYFHEMSPFMGKEDEGYFEAEAKVIFLEVPEARSFTEVVGKEEVKLTINDVSVDPIEVERNFIFEDFEIPQREKLVFWFILFLIVCLAAGMTYFFRKRIIRAKNKKAVLERVKSEVLTCKNYEDVVLIWRNKREYLKIYPELENCFKKLENVLFKHQFKPYRKDEEVKEVMNAYVKFSSEVEGVLRGI